jgi:hypothetical protein
MIVQYPGSITLKSLFASLVKKRRLRFPLAVDLEPIEVILVNPVAFVGGVFARVGATTHRASRIYQILAITGNDTVGLAREKNASELSPGAEIGGMAERLKAPVLKTKFSPRKNSRSSKNGFHRRRRSNLSVCKSGNGKPWSSVLPFCCQFVLSPRLECRQKFEQLRWEPWAGCPVPFC